MRLISAVAASSRRIAPQATGFDPLLKPEAKPAAKPAAEAPKPEAAKPVADAPKPAPATPKPVALWDKPIMNHTQPGEFIYEPFAGSGSQIIAAEMAKRRCLAMELDPLFIDVCVHRWEAFTGQKAVRAEAGR